MNELIKKVIEGMSWKAWLQLVGFIVLFSAMSGGAEEAAGVHETARHQIGHLGSGWLMSFGTFILGRLFRNG